MDRKPRILVVGIFVMDLIASTKQAPNRGETVIGLNFRTAPGGKGANQAVQCARLGADVTMAGRVGDDAYGRETVAAAAAAGVDVSRVVVDAENPTGVSAITLEITETGAHNRIVVCPGANGAMTVEEISWIRDEVKNYDLVMLQFELPMFINEAVARWAHDAGVPVMVNPAPTAPAARRGHFGLGHRKNRPAKATAAQNSRIAASEPQCRSRAYSLVAVRASRRSIRSAGTRGSFRHSVFIRFT